VNAAERYVKVGEKHIIDNDVYFQAALVIPATGIEN